MNTPYGQADYYYAVSRKMLAALVDKELITLEQRERIDKLNQRTIFARYPSIADWEVSA